MHNYLFLYLAQSRNEELRQVTDRPAPLMSHELKRMQRPRRRRRGSR